MQRVLADPRQLGYGQLDVFVLEGRQLKADTAFAIARQDDVRECVFAVTRNKDIDQLRPARGLRRQAALHPAAGGLRQRRHLPVPAQHRCRRARQGQGRSATPPRRRTPSARRCRPTTPSACSCSSPIPTTRASIWCASWAAIWCRSSTATSCARRSAARRSTSRRRRRSRTRSGSSRAASSSPPARRSCCSPAIPTACRASRPRRTTRT